MEVIVLWKILRTKFNKKHFPQTAINYTAIVKNYFAALGLENPLLCPIILSNTFLLQSLVYENARQ